MEDNQALIEEMIRGAEGAEEPGEIVRQRVIHEGDEDLPVPMVATKLVSAGYVYIYDTETGECSLTNRNMLPAQLKKKRPDGSNVFTTLKPAIPPKRGNLKCMLHPKGSNRKHYDELGLAVCPKDNLTSPFQVRRHMEKRHKMEWGAIEQERIDAEKKQDREFQEVLLKAAIKPHSAVDTKKRKVK